MDTIALLRQLNQEIAEKQMARDRILDGAAGLTTELRELESQRELLAGLVARVGVHDSEPEIPDDGRQKQPRSPANDGEPETEQNSNKMLRVKWPIAPHYQKKVRAKNHQAWAWYKLESADWYLSTLRRISQQIPKLDRYIGVEMAVDATLQALTGAFDAAVYALTRAVEKALRVPDERCTPVHLASWATLAVEARLLNVDLPCVPAVTAALKGEHTERPEGWLAQLQMLSKYAARRDLLIRHWSGAGPGVGIEVPGAGPQPPLEYLVAARNATEELLGIMLQDAEDARNGRLHVAGMDRQRRAKRQQPDVMQRAKVHRQR